MQLTKFVLTIFVLAFAFLSCQTLETVSFLNPTPTTAPSITPLPTRTIEPTFTAIPTSTETPTRTSTPRPSRPPSTPTPIPPGSARSNPAPIGVPVFWKSPDGKYQLYDKVVEVHRGNDAWSMVSQANMFNPAPPSGREYIVVKLRVDYVNGPPNEVYTISGISCVVVSSDNRVFTWTEIVVVPPEPKLNRQLYPGGYAEGNLVYPIPLGDPKPLMQCGRNPNGTGGTWHSLN